MNKSHILKTDPQPYQDVHDGRKKFELRKDDRPFEAGDELVLHETRFTGEQMAEDPKRYPLQYTGRFNVVIVTHLLRGPCYGLPAGWVIMSIA